MSRQECVPSPTRQEHLHTRLYNPTVSNKSACWSELVLYCLVHQGMWEHNHHCTCTTPQSFQWQMLKSSFWGNSICWSRGKLSQTRDYFRARQQKAAQTDFVLLLLWEVLCSPSALTTVVFSSSPGSRAVRVAVQPNGSKLWLIKSPAIWPWIGSKCLEYSFCETGH